jgi:hypothetical protein
MFRTQKKCFSVDSEIHLLNPLFTVDSVLDLQELTGAAIENVESHTCR